MVWDNGRREKRCEFIEDQTGKGFKLRRGCDMLDRGDAFRQEQIVCFKVDIEHAVVMTGFGII